MSGGSSVPSARRVHPELLGGEQAAGFTNTASTTSAITYIDGGAGILRYRGYPIDQLAKGSNFLEVAYLLIYGELPDAQTLEAVERRIKRHTILHEDFKAFFTAFPHNGHPMAILQAGIAALATYYQHTLDPHDPTSASSPPCCSWPRCRR
ncbi:citrate/2-methylcitrate synthase [Georgenia sp. SUBG003]|uniref:citrate/2-methylcitrate synthase n=1 Tax=Georgenia sp. SUBG003 TaxID=1497974 RepID=UPI003AB7C377